MMNPEAEANLLRFLNRLDGRLKSVADDQKALWLSLRSTCDFFKATGACVAVLPPGKALAELMFVIPREGVWDLGLLTAFLHRQKPAIPPHTLLAPLIDATVWGGAGLRSRGGGFDRNVDPKLSIESPRRFQSPSTAWIGNGS